MQYFFTAPALDRLRRLADPALLCVFDFDGTLAPIVADPAAVSLPPAIRDRMRTLCGLGKVGILTGRAIDDIAPRLGFTPHYLIGNHGIEGVPGWDRRDQEYAHVCRDWVQAIGNLLHDRTDFDPAIRLEDKHVSLSLHYRQTQDPQHSASQLQEALRQLQPAPRIVGGKYVFNLMPPGAADKGSAIAQLLAVTKARGAVYVGDDVTDEDVFRLHRDDIVGIRTEYTSQSEAEFFLHSQSEIPRLLDELTRSLAPSGARPPAAAQQGPRPLS